MSTPDDWPPTAARLRRDILDPLERPTAKRPIVKRDRHGLRIVPIEAQGGKTP